MNDKKNLAELEALFSAGDAWLMRYGVASPILHNNIVLNLYVNFPKVRFVEYLIPSNPDDRRIHVIMHFSITTLLFKNKEKLVDQIMDLLKEYLHDYDITVELKRFKGVPKADEKPASSNSNPSESSKS